MIGINHNSINLCKLIIHQFFDIANDNTFSPKPFSVRSSRVQTYPWLKLGSSNRFKRILVVTSSVVGNASKTVGTQGTKIIVDAIKYTIIHVPLLFIAKKITKAQIVKNFVQSFMIFVYYSLGMARIIMFRGDDDGKILLPGIRMNVILE